MAAEIKLKAHVLANAVLLSVISALFFRGDVIFVGVSAQPAEEEVKSLPGLVGPLSSKQYSGYLQASGTIKLHYWFVESQGNPSKDPVLLWLSGGPSCSSDDSYLTSLGPYLVNSDGKTLRANEYSWTKVASVIFLESPAGVGYSYAASQDYTTNDNKTAENNYLALLDFFKKFPNMTKNEFFITGESYAGIYIPTLAYQVMQNKNVINFKGFAIGNGVLDWKLLAQTSFEYGYYHGIISESLWRNLQVHCCSDGSCHYINSTDLVCIDDQKQAHKLFNHIGINPYDTTGDCNGSYSGHSSLLDIFQFYTPWSNRSPTPKLQSSFLPCIDTVTPALYMNRPDVRSALHIPETAAKKWAVCNPPLAANYTNQYQTMRPFFQALLPKYRALVYNGDADIVCNFLGDQKFVASLNYPKIGSRRPWFVNKQVAGFVREYKQVTFMTIKNSGHMVPANTPERALKMISNFLEDRPQ